MTNRYNIPPESAHSVLAELKHEFLTTGESLALTEELTAILQGVHARDFMQRNTMPNFRMQQVMSAVEVTDTQCPELHRIFQNALKNLEDLFGPELPPHVRKTTLWRKLDANANATSLAFQGADPVIIITDSLLRLVSDASGKYIVPELTAVLMHELGHVVYADCECLFCMKIYTTLLRDGTIDGELCALTQAQAANKLFTGLEFTADRVMFKTSEWPSILNVFAKLAGGYGGETIDGELFFKQLEKLDPNAEAVITTGIMMANPHQPILERLKELKNFRENHTLGNT